MWFQSRAAALTRRVFINSTKTNGRSGGSFNFGRSGAAAFYDTSCNNNHGMLMMMTQPTTTSARSFSASAAASSSSSLMDLIKELRAASGAPIVDCKKALAATSNNDIQEALDWLRKSGAAKVTSKVGDRDATEGLVGIEIAEDNKSASLVRVSSETDFAGRSETFVDLVTHCAKAALQTTTTTTSDGEFNVSDLLQVQVDNDDNSKTVEEVLNEAIVSIRENLSLASAINVTISPADDENGGVVVGYVHNRILPSNAGTAAALVELCPIDNDNASDVDKETLLQIGKNLAMHCVAAKPLYLDVASVPAQVVESERTILMEQMESDSKMANKPKDILEKIVNGRLRKFYDTNCLVEQNHMIVEENPKIENYLKTIGIRLNRFYLISIA